MSQEDIIISNAPIKGKLFKVILVRSQESVAVFKEQHEKATQFVDILGRYRLTSRRVRRSSQDSN